MSGADTLPAAVRSLVLSHTAEALGAMAPEDIPGSLRRVARFTPRKRATAASGPLTVALDDDVFRAAVSASVRARRPLQVAAVAASEGADVQAVDVELADLGALLWLLRPEGWEVRLAEVADALVAREEATADGVRAADLERLAEALEAERATHRVSVAELRSEVAAAKADREHQTKTVRRATDRAQRAEAEMRSALATAQRQVAEAERRVADLEAELRRTRARLGDAESAVSAGRASIRRERDGDTVRLRVLLDALLGAAQGLRHELALAPAEGRPGDLVEARVPDVVAPSSQGRPLDDPGSLERLLAIPAVHLVVDGYNVTKTAWGALSLEQQRDRLVGGVAALVARTRIEATVVFDGAERDTTATTPAPRGVRVRFSDPGEIADELIARFVSAEPQGRPLVVVSSDGEVAAHARQAGAHAVPSMALVRLLDRS